MAACREQLGWGPQDCRSALGLLQRPGRRRLSTAVILAEGDATAVAAAHEIKRREFKGLIDLVQSIPSDSHTFARPGDAGALFGATLALLRRLGG